MKKRWVTQLRNKEDIKIAILCVMAASIFWFFHAMNDNHSTDINYPIEVLYDTNKIIQTDKIPKQVTVHVSGYGWHLLNKQLNLTKKPCIIQITDPYKQKFLTNSQVRTLIANQLNTDDITINQIKGDTFFLPFDWYSHKKVQIAMDEEKIDSLHSLKDLHFSFNSVMTHGPRKMIEALKDTILLDIPAINQKKSIHTTISLNDYFPSLIRLNDTVVKVHVELFEYKIQIIDLPIYVINSADKEILYHKRLNLSYHVREDSVQAVKPESFKAVINYQKGDSKNVYFVEVIKKPSFVIIDHIEPQTITIR